MATRIGRTAYERGASDGRSAVVIDPPADAVNKSVAPVSLDSNDTAFSQHVPVVKSTNESGDFLLFGVVMRPLAVDAHGEFADAILVRKSSHDFLAGYGTDNGMGVQHKEFDHPIELVESAIETVDHEKHGLQVLAGDWTVTARVNDDALKEQVTKSALTGFSIGGFGSKTKIAAEDQPVAKSLDGGVRQAVAKFTRLSVHEISLVDSPANEITFVVAKRRSKDNEMKIQTDNQAALAAAQAQATALQEKLDAANAELASAKTHAETAPTQVVNEPAKAADTTPAPSADAQVEIVETPDPVTKARRFTKTRAAALKTLQEQQAAAATALAALIADISGDAEDADSGESPAAETVVITKAVPQVDIEAAVAKALKPTNDEIAVLKQKLEAANAELEVVKSARLPATSRKGESVAKQRDRTDLWGNLI